MLATPIQFFFELFCIYLVKVKVNTDRASENCKLLSYQVAITMIFIMLGAMFIHDIYNVFAYGRPSYVISTFLLCVVIDNVKSIVSLALIYCIVVRRFMHLSVNEHEYIDLNADKKEKKENAIPKLKIFCLKFLESAPVESVSLIIIAIYAVFVLFWLVHEEFTGKNFQKVDDNIMSSID